MSDYIDRQAAIDALEREKSLVERPITETRWFDLGLGKAQDVLSKLPSAEVEPVKRGVWLAIGNTGLASCSCGFFTDRYSIYNYCPNCGAKMENEE